EGSIQVRSYTDRDGNKRRAWEIVCDHAYFAEGKRDGAPRAASAAPAPAINTAGDAAFSELEDESDDLPF
ncbi:MAG: single-stranded DNA-binding protein, partial [Clostridia bacterium]|nr:single-stranded DNA-binding protein [Clostridia bacterium]